jgi:hypothetical protein
MQTIRRLERTGKDGTLLLRIPLEKPDTAYEVLVVVQPTEAVPLASTPEARGWPPGYFDKTYGSITDDTFERAPQGTMPKPLDDNVA